MIDITVYVDLEGSSYIYSGSNAIISNYENEARTISYINLDDYSSYTKKVVIKNSRRETYTATLDNNNSFSLLDGHLSEGKLLLQLYMYFGDVQIRDNTIIKLNVVGSLNNSTEIEAGTTLATEIQSHIDDDTIHFLDAPEDDTIYGRINGSWEIVGGSGGSTVWGTIGGTLTNQTDLKNALDGKANTGHTHDDRYYTETETNTLLSGKSDTSHTHTDLHTHANKALLDTYTQSNTDITTAITNSHTHTNKAVLDDIIDSGDGNSFLANDGTYKPISGGGAVDSVNGETGVVVLDSDDVSEGSVNLYLSGNEFQKNTDDMDDITNGTTYVKTENNYTDAEVTKLSGIETGAEVNNISDANVTTLTGGSSADTLHKHAEITEQRASTQMKVWYGTTAQYTAIGTKDANTIYFCS